MRLWQERSRDRLPDGLWHATLQRVRGEFEEMPGVRVTFHQARALFGLPGSLCEWILSRLLDEGFLARTSDGVYVRRTTVP